jgi:hypothetical protein
MLTELELNHMPFMQSLQTHVIDDTIYAVALGRNGRVYWLEKGEWLRIETISERNRTTTVTVDMEVDIVE